MTTDSEQTTSPQALPKIGRKKKPRPDHCLNCGTPATGKFCAECGQEIKDHSVSLGPLLTDALSEFASWDSKLVRTVVALVIHPGFLTNEYNMGHRVPYLSPLKLYLTVSVLFFLLLPWAHPVATFVHIKPGAVTIGSGKDERVQSASMVELHKKPHTAFERAMERGAAKANESPQVFIAALVGDIPKMMFFLLPPLLLFHPDWLIVAVTLALWVYLLAAMHVVYKQGWVKTVVKMQVILLGYGVLLTLCIAGTSFAALWLL